MKNILFIFFGCLFILYLGRYSYWAWFKSKDYIKMTHQKRRNYRKTIIKYLPPAVMFDFLDENPLLEIWMMRIASIFGILFIIIWIIAGIYGPFTF